MFASALLLSLAACAAAQYSATYLPDTAPDHTEEGQTGTNKCGTNSSQSSMCQNAYINGVDDFCLWAPPEAGADSAIGNTERIEVAWCMKSGYGTRLIPDGTITGAHFVKSADFVQITGVGDLTKLNIPAGDAGGELDPHGADGNGNPIGGLVFSTAFGGLQQIHEWTNFMAADQFCFRACDPAGKDPAAYCQHIYDVMGCGWNMPANYDPGLFESCDADSGEPMGVYGGSTFHQGDAATPEPHPVPASSNCKNEPTIANGAATPATATVTGGSKASSSGVSQSSVASSSAASSTSSAASSSGASTTTSHTTTHRAVATGSGSGSATADAASASTSSTPDGAISVSMNMGTTLLVVLVGFYFL
ncbi:hypothetical protein CYLTODRAFT_428616 [Cylindrobasidium torrendii FP15055 ss-10]|uniref:Macrofage activating glycoprotein n=1 Tax=Cylindrobasidium torrendii FP15055 ss-10 TaxID=1314674 RepID=A0A0D7BT07_9AGAR|nr:hypothetical protein CYLTODRAFT_428616 [Cylindrobasidium torrendii FP15055 ss-10]